MVGLHDGEVDKAWLKILSVLDEHSISSEDALLISDMLQFGALGIDDDSATMMKLTSFRPNSGFENIPIMKTRWGLDPSLITTDN